VYVLCIGDNPHVSHLEKEDSEVEVLATCEVSVAAIADSCGNISASRNTTQLSRLTTAEIKTRKQT